MRISLLIIFVILVAGAYVGGNTYDRDAEFNTTRDIINWTESVFVWNSSNLEPMNITELHELNSNSSSTLINSNRITNMINKVVDCAGYMLMEFVKWGVEFGYKNPQYNYQYVVDLLPTIAVLVLLLPFLPWMTVAFVFLVVVLGYYLYKLGLCLYKKHYLKQTGGEKK